MTKWLTTVATSLLAAALLAPAAAAQPRSIELVPRAAAFVAAASPVGSQQVECVARRGATPDVKLDCDDDTPNNEPHIAVDPANPKHLVASSNDYSQCCDQMYASFDGGRTWHNSDISKEDASRTGSDPVTSFDVAHGGVVLHASLNYQILDRGVARDGDVVVSRSLDGGTSWQQPVVVADGDGADDAPVQLFNDKEWIATDNDPGSPHYGRTYVTWTAFLSHFGATQESPIMEAHSDDGGRSFSHPQEISGGSARYCQDQLAGPAGQCDEDQASSIAIGPDGTVSVGFVNGQHHQAQEAGEGGLTADNQELVVQSHDGGVTWAAPVHVVDQEDGGSDLPRNVNGDLTLSGLQLRMSTFGTLAADPRTGRLYLVYSDNSDGLHDVDHPVTNIDVFITSSADGTSWSAPLPVLGGRGSAGDQWFPTLAVSPVDGRVGVLFNDNRARGSVRYWASFATGHPGAFSRRTVSSGASHPDSAVAFKAQIDGCWHCTTFDGDYIGAAYGSDGAANLVWADMSAQVGGHGRYGQFIDFRRLR